MRSKKHAPRLRLSAAASIATFLIVLAACGASGTALEVRDNLGNPDAASSDDRRLAGADAGPGGPPFADLAERKIIKTGEVTLEVASIGTAVGVVRAMAVSLGGYVGGSSGGTEDEPASLTLRLPAERFEEALGRLRAMDATITAEATNERDVTSSVVDLEARITNLEASERQYRRLIERAQKVSDILAVQSRLDSVRGQIEQLKAQLEQLSGLAALSTLTVTLVPSSTSVEDVSEGWDPGATFDQALASLVGLGQGISDLLIWMVVVVVPIGLVGGVALLIAWRVAPAIRRRFPVAPTVPPGSPSGTSE
jgi:hypothetical protein